MKGVIFFLVFMGLAVMVDDTTMQSNHNDLRHRSQRLEQTRKGMYRVKRGHWCQWCPIGKYLVKDCEYNRGLSICNTCPENQYMNKLNNRKSCHPCTNYCPIGTHLVKHCTTTSNRVCQCPLGKFWHVYLGHTGFCKTHRKCPGRTLAEGTPWNDTVCGVTTSVFKPQSTTPTTPTTLPPETTTLSTTDSPVLTTSPCTPCVPCQSQQQCCDKWFVIAVVALVFLGIAVAILLVELAFVIYYFRRKHSYAT